MHQEDVHHLLQLLPVPGHCSVVQVPLIQFQTRNIMVNLVNDGVEGEGEQQ